MTRRSLGSPHPCERRVRSGEGGGKDKCYSAEAALKLSETQRRRQRRGCGNERRGASYFMTTSILHSQACLASSPRTIVSPASGMAGCWIAAGAGESTKAVSADVNKASIQWLIGDELPSTSGTADKTNSTQNFQLPALPAATSMAALQASGLAEIGIRNSVFASVGCVPRSDGDLSAALEVLASAFCRHPAPAWYKNHNQVLRGMLDIKSEMSQTLQHPAADSPSRKRGHDLVDGAVSEQQQPQQRQQPFPLAHPAPAASVESALKQCSRPRMNSASQASAASEANTPVHSPNYGEEDTEGDSATGSSDEKTSQGIALDHTTAADIYIQRPRDAGTRYGSMSLAAKLARMYDVSPKTIRDIWNRKSWVKATRSLWTEKEQKEHVPRRHRSREERRANARQLAALK